MILKYQTFRNDTPWRANIMKFTKHTRVELNVLGRAHDNNGSIFGKINDAVTSKLQKLLGFVESNVSIRQEVELSPEEIQLIAKIYKDQLADDRKNFKSDIEIVNAGLEQLFVKSVQTGKKIGLEIVDIMHEAEIKSYKLDVEKHRAFREYLHEKKKIDKEFDALDSDSEKEPDAE